MDTIHKKFCVLAISLSTRGFGYAIMEGKNDLLTFANKAFREDKNAKSLTAIEKIIKFYQPDVLVLQDVYAKGTFRATRIKELHRDVMNLAKQCQVKVADISQREQRVVLLGREDGTRQEMAEAIAVRFSDDLAFRLPPKRKPWQSEDSRMDFFDAVGLTVCYWTSKGK